MRCKLLSLLVAATAALAVGCSGDGLTGPENAADAPDASFGTVLIDNHPVPPGAGERVAQCPPFFIGKFVSLGHPQDHNGDGIVCQREGNQ